MCSTVEHIPPIDCRFEPTKEQRTWQQYSTNKHRQRCSSRPALTVTAGCPDTAAVFNNIDQVGDIILPGAFTKGLDTFRREGYLAIGHEHAALPVGTIDVAQEDMRGLWIESDLHGTAAAQELRGVAQARISKGKSLGLSIGFIIPAGGYEFRDDGVRLLKEIDLREVSVTPSPANREALISGVKQALADLDLDGKEGRAISQDRRARLAAIRDALATLKDLQGELDDLLAETEPPGGAGGGGEARGWSATGKSLSDCATRPDTSTA